MTLFASQLLWVSHSFVFKELFLFSNHYAEIKTLRQRVKESLFLLSSHCVVCSELRLHIQHYSICRKFVLSFYSRFVLVAEEEVNLKISHLGVLLFSVGKKKY